MAAVETKEQITLKLMVIKEKNKVLFAEAGKDFVDVLFSFLTLPLGTIARLVRNESNVEPMKVALLSSLYQCVENIDRECLSSDTHKEMLLRPKNSMEAYCRSLKLNIDDTEPTKYFVCENLIQCRENSPVLLTPFEDKRCRCGSMLKEPISPETSVVFDGFVKRNGSFMITDDLKVLPSSLEIILSLLKDSGIKDMAAVNEITVAITKNQVIDLLKICLFSKKTLTYFFLEKPPCKISFETGKFSPIDFKANDCGKIIVKIMRRKSNGKIVFAQRKNDFADFLFSLLTIPLGRVSHLMDGRSSIGSIDILYRSVVDLDEDYWTTKEAKCKLVNPVLAAQFKLINLQLPIYVYDDPKYFCYVELNPLDDYVIFADYLTSTPKQNHYYSSCTVTEFVDPVSDTGNNSKGYAQGPSMYMVTDDLVVKPLSSISVISLLNSLSVPVDDLEEKVVSIGMKEGIRLLHASLTSTSALTTGLSHLFTKFEKEDCY